MQRFTLVWLSCVEGFNFVETHIRNAQVVGLFLKKSDYASMAQLVEQRIRNAQVVGSSPTTSFKKVVSIPKGIGATFC